MNDDGVVGSMLSGGYADDTGVYFRVALKRFGCGS